MTTPVEFQPSGGGRSVYGYKATLLPQVCNVYLEARDVGALLPSQLHIVKRAEIIIHGLATVGVIALVDEATDYQHICTERALVTILEKFIAKALWPWTKTFPYEFYKQIFRLKGWSGPDGVKRPGVLSPQPSTLHFQCYGETMSLSLLDSSSWQASVGEKALGLKVVDKNGDRISFGRATGRHFAKIISGLTILIGYMMVGWTKRKEGLHDMIAGTLAYQDRKKR